MLKSATTLKCCCERAGSASLVPKPTTTSLGLHYVSCMAACEAACAGPAGVTTYKLSVINGVPFPPFITKERMDELRDFTLLSDDLFIVSYPKSGTTWMQQIVKLIRSNGVEDGQRIDHTIPWLEENTNFQVNELTGPRLNVRIM